MYPTERLNSITHLIGALAAIAGTAVLVTGAAREGDPWKIVSFSLYGTSLVMLYTFSTLYHSFRGKPKAVFRKLDHLAIYLLIAGTYTPICLVTLRGPWGWSVFGVVWGLAIAGMVIDLLPRKGNRFLPVAIYLLMGWTCLIAIKPLLQVMPFSGFLWLLAGGLLYTAGVIFYVLDERLRHSHGIWHLFVIGGSLAHFITILRYVA